MISSSLGSSRKFHALLGNSGKLGEFAQALFPLMVCQSDDFGRLEGDAFTIKHKVFPTSPRPERDFQKALEAMDRVGLIQLYIAEGITCIQILAFDDHQSGLHKRTKSKFPEPPGNSRKFPEIPSEQNRTEQNRNRREQNTMSPSGDVVVVFEYWKEIHGHPKARLDEKRKRLVIHALKEYPVEDLKKAIDGCKLSPHHQGKNDKGIVYDDIELICRDSKHVEQFMGYAENGLARPPDPYEEIERLYESYGNQDAKDKPIH